MGKPQPERLAEGMQVQAVIVGHDRNINYFKIQYATLCIRENPGCQFIATNLDAVTHLTDAQEWAGNGAMVGAIKGLSYLIFACAHPHMHMPSECTHICFSSCCSTMQNFDGTSHEMCSLISKTCYSVSHPS